ncbi:MAG: PAS domain S-box protein [Spirochaetales bacterium]|nr:PAS domain S-box protein [Spirochaetales bacterium]
MNFRSIRSRLNLATLLILLLSLLGSMWIANRSFATTLRESTYTELANHTTYLSSLLSEDPQMWKESIFSNYAKTTGARITLIDSEGVVRFDSDYPIESLNNHLYREEVQHALISGRGTSERPSSTENLPVLYQALRLEGHPELSVLRLSKTLVQLEEYHRRYQKLFFSGLTLLLLLCLLITALSVTMLTKGMRQLKALADSYARGDLKAHARIEGPQELADLSITMQEMAQTVQSKIEEVEAGKNQLEAILNSLSEAILLLDSNFVVKVANKEAERLFSTEKLLNRRLSQIVSSSQLLSLCSSSLQDDQIHELTISQYGHLFGETAQVVGRSRTRTLHIIGLSIRSTANQRVGVVLSINDMTELKHLEQIRKDFVANVSHELKTPITSIAGFAEALAGSQEKADIIHFSQIINRQATNMQHIVEDLLLLSSLEQQQAKPTMSWVPAQQIIAETEAQCSYRFQQKGSSLITHLSNPEELELFVNGMLIVQALTNLLINALTYSESGSVVHLNIDVGQREVVMQVRDTGIGIPLEDQERIFERFYRVDAARSRRQGGTGLGLSIVKHIAAVHSGTVSVQSELGKGSTFTLTLPRASKELASMQDRSSALYSR